MAAYFLEPPGCWLKTRTFIRNQGTVSRCQPYVAAVTHSRAFGWHQSKIGALLFSAARIPFSPKALPSFLGIYSSFSWSMMI